MAFLGVDNVIVVLAVASELSHANLRNNASVPIWFCAYDCPANKIRIAVSTWIVLTINMEIKDRSARVQSDRRRLSA